MPLVEMTIDSIRVSLMNYQRVVILKEKYAERYLPIWIGPAEADAIADPAIDPISIAPITLIKANPPGNEPTKVLAKAISR